MLGTKEQFDADRTENRVIVTTFPTGPNQHKLLCSSCSGTFYAERQLYESVLRSIEASADNPFLCNDCQEEYGELAHLGR